MEKRVALRLTGLRLSVCKLSGTADADPGGFYSLTCTGREISMVCETARVPQNAVRCENGYTAFEVLGPLNLSVTGVVSGITAPLAQRHIAVFVLSTFDTDYILLKEEKLEKAIEALVAAGYTVVQ